MKRFLLWLVGLVLGVGIFLGAVMGVSYAFTTEGGCPDSTCLLYTSYFLRAEGAFGPKTGRRSRKMRFTDMADEMFGAAQRCV